MATLSHERAGVARMHLGLSRKLDQLLRDARHRPALQDPIYRDRVAALYSQIACMRWTTNRDLTALGRGMTTVGRRRERHQADVGPGRPGAGRPRRRLCWVSTG